MNQVNNILVLRIGGIGDVVTATPVLRSLRSNYPHSHISMICEKTPSEVVKYSHWVDEFIIDDYIHRCQSFSKLLKPEGLLRLLSLYNQISARNYQLFIELHRLNRWSLVLKPWLFALMSEAQLKAGLDTYGRGFFLDRKIYDNPEIVKCQVKWFGDILDSLDLNYESLKPEIVIPDRYQTKSQEILTSKIPENSKPLVGMFLGANPEFPEKYWPVEKFSDLARKITMNMDVTILGFAGPEDQDTVDKFEKLTSGENDILSLKQVPELIVTTAIIDGFDYFISVDTGPMHLGVGVNTPTLGIFGPGEWHWYGTYPENYAFERVGPAEMDPNGKVPDLPQGKMDDITVEEVYQSFIKLWQKF